MTMQNERQIKRKPQPLYVAIGLFGVAAGLGLDFFYPHLTIAHLPSWINIASELRCLGIGFVVGGLIGRRPPVEAR